MLFQTCRTRIGYLRENVKFNLHWTETGRVTARHHLTQALQRTFIR